MACKTDSPVSSSSYSSGDEADSTQADAHTSVADSDCNTAIKVINKLMPSMMELIHLEIDVVLSKAYSAGFVGKEMLDKGIKNDPKQVARQFIDAACTQIEMNFDIKFKAFLDIFRDIASLETIAHRIEDEIKKTQKPKLKKKRKRKNKKLPKSNVAPEACSYSSGFDEISTTATTGDYLPTSPQQVLNESVATENPSGDQNSGMLIVVSVSHSGTVTHSNTGVRTFNEPKVTSTCDILDSESIQGRSIEETPTSSTENGPATMVISTEQQLVTASYEEFDRKFSSGKKKVEQAMEEMSDALAWHKRERAKLQEELQKRSQDLQDCIHLKQQEIENLKDSCDSEIEELTRNHMTKMKKMESECATQKDELEDLKIEFDQHRSDAKNKIECLKSAHHKEMKEEQEKHEKEKEKLKSECEKEIARLRETVDKEEREAKLKEENLKLTCKVEEKSLMLEYERKISDIKDRVNLLELEKRDLEKEVRIQKAEAGTQKALMDHLETKMQLNEVHSQLRIREKEIKEMKFVHQQQIQAREQEESGSQASRSQTSRSYSDSASNTSMSISIVEQQTLMHLNVTQSSDVSLNVLELHSDNSKSS